MRTVLVAVAAFAVGLLLGTMLFPDGVDDFGDPAPEGSAASPGSGPANSASRPDPRETWEQLPPDNPLSRDFSRMSRSEISDRLRALCREESGEGYPSDLLAASTDAARKTFEQYPDGMLRLWMLRDLETHRMREATGVLENPVDILIQMRDVAHDFTLTPLSASAEEVARHLVDEPLDTRTPMRPGTPARIFLRGGMIPPEHSLVITRVEMSVNLGYSDPKVRFSRTGDAEIGLEGDEVFKIRRHLGLLEASFEGSRRIEAGREKSITFRVSGGCGSVRIQGHLVSRTEPSALPDVPFTWVPHGSVGFMDGKQVTVDLFAGRSVARMTLKAGDKPRVNRMHHTELLHSGISPEKTKDSLGYIEGLGPLPPGMAWKITRIEVQGQFGARDAKRSTFEIESSLVREPLVVASGARRRSVSGRWRGALLLTEKDLDGLKLELKGTGVVRAVFSGSMVPVSGD